VENLLQLNSFVSSLEILFKDKEFSNLSTSDKVGFLEAFWEGLRDLIPDALEKKEKKKIKQ